MGATKDSFLSRAEQILAARAARSTAEDSAAWAAKPLEARRKAFWSAKLYHAQHVAELKEACLGVLGGKTIKVRDLKSATWTPEQLEEIDPATGIKRGDQEMLMTKSLIISEMRARAMARGLDEQSKAGRIGLIVDMAVGTSIGRAKWEEDAADGEMLDIAPALELVRNEPRKEPRDWDTRWREGAEAVNWEGVYHGDNGATKIAMFHSPIWVAISAFGEPFPPFDYNSGMGTRRVTRAELHKLGWKVPRQPPPIQPPPGVEIDVSDLSKTEREWLEKTLGPDIAKLDGDTLTIQNAEERRAADEEAKRAEEEAARKAAEEAEKQRAALEAATQKVESELPGLEARLAAVEADIPTKISVLANHKNSVALDAIEKDAFALMNAVDGFADAPEDGRNALKTRIHKDIRARIEAAKAMIHEQDAENRRLTKSIFPAKKAVKKAEEQVAAGDLKKAEAFLDAATAAIPSARADIAATIHPQFIPHYEAIVDELERRISDARDAIEKARQAQARAKAGGKLPPLQSTAHFPDKITPDLIEKSTVKGLGGTTGARLVEIDGRKYVCKTTGGGQGVTAEHVRNEADADQAYRRAGIRVPDCRIYEVGGKTYKLAEYIDGGKTLGEWLKTATPAQKEAMRKELAQGYALDALFANWDVVGTAQDNILVDGNGHAWRIDNGSAFAFRAQGARKKPEEWEKREWPDEWRTLRTSGINKGVFDQLTAQEIFHAMNQLDVDAAVAGLPQQTQKAIAKPLAEMKQLAARCADFDKEGFVPKVTTHVLEATYDLSKEGFREEVPRQISLGNYGFCRKSSSGGGQGLPDYAGDIKKAAISINAHAGFGKSSADYSPNMTSVNTALAHKADLQKYAATDPNAAALLKNIAEIEQAQAAGWHITAKLSNVKDLHVTPPGRSTPKYVSLTDHLYARAKADGVDVGRIAGFFKSQGGSSWNTDACKLKVLNLAMRGKEWNPPPWDPEVFFGNQGNYFSVAHQYSSAVVYYLQNPAQMEADMKALAYWKSATQLLLENASFDGNHPEARFMYHMRTDDESFFGANKKDGTVQSAYRIGACESGCPIKSKQVYSGPYVGVRQVPYSRLNSIFFMDARPQGGSMYLGDGERECGADLTGLPVFAAGKFGSGYEIASHEKKVEAAFAAFRAANP